MLNLQPQVLLTMWELTALNEWAAALLLSGHL